MKTTVFIIFVYLLFGCNQNPDLDQIFRNEKHKILFKEFYTEALHSDYRDGDKIIISLYGEISEEEYCMSIDNVQYYKSNDKFGKFRYKEFVVYVNQNVPKSIIELQKYNQNIRVPYEGKDRIPPKQEFLEMYICVQQDTMKVMRVNFEDNKYLNKWQIIN